MSKEKLASLTKYLNSLTNSLSEPIPTKHKSHPDSYKSFLKHEMDMVKATIDRAKELVQK